MSKGSKQATQEMEEEKTAKGGGKRSSVKKDNIVKIEKPLKSYVGQVSCGICNQTAKIEDFKTDHESQRMMFCYTCATTVHVCCNGVGNKYETTKSGNNEEVLRFLCDRCEAKKQGKTLGDCVACNDSSAYLKRTKEGQWIHVACAIASDDVVIEDFENMIINAKKLKESPAATVTGTTSAKGKGKKSAVPPPAPTGKPNYVYLFKRTQTRDHCLEENDSHLVKSLKGLVDKIQKFEKDNKEAGELIPKTLTDTGSEMEIEGEKKKGKKSKKSGDLAKELIERTNTRILEDLSTLTEKKEDDEEEMKGKKKGAETSEPKSLRGGRIILVSSKEEEKKVLGKSTVKDREAFTKHVVNGFVHVLEPPKTDAAQTFRADLKQILVLDDKPVTLRDIIMLAVIYARHYQRSLSGLVQVELARANVILACCLPLNYINESKSLFRKIYFSYALDLVIRGLLHSHPINKSAYDEGKNIWDEGVVKGNLNLLDALLFLMNYYDSDECHIISKQYTDQQFAQKSLENVIRAFVHFNPKTAAISDTRRSDFVLTNSEIPEIRSETKEILDLVGDQFPELKKFAAALEDFKAGAGASTILEKIRQDEKRQKEMRLLVALQEKSNKTIDKKGTIPILNGRRTQNFEQSINKFIGYLKERLTLQEAKDAVSVSTTKPDEVNALRPRIEKAEAWLEKYSMKEKKIQFEELWDLVKESVDVGLTTDEIESAVVRWRQVLLWAYDFFKIRDRLKHKRKEVVDESEIVKTSELQNLLDQLDKLTVDIDETDEKIKETLGKVREAFSLGDTLKDRLKSAMDFKKLMELEGEFKGVNVELPELSALRAKIKRHNEIKALVDSTQELELLETKLQELKKASKEQAIDVGLLSDLESKITNGRKLQDKCRAFLSTDPKGRQLSEDDILTLNLIAYETKNHKVRCAEMNETDKALGSCFWIEALNNVFHSYEEASSTGSRMEIESVGIPSAGTLFSCPGELVNYIKYSKTQLAILPQDIPALLFSELKALVEEGRKLRPIRDPRIEEIFTTLNNLVWKQQSREFLVATNTTLDELTTLVNEAPAATAKQRKEDTTYTYLSDRLKKIQKWISAYNDFMATGPSTSIFQLIEKGTKDADKELTSMKNTLTDLYKEFSEEYEDKVPEIADFGKEVKRYLNWIYWGTQASKCLDDMSKKMRLSSVEELNSMYEKAIVQNIPKDVSLFTKFEEYYYATREVIADYTRLYEKVGYFDEKEAHELTSIDLPNYLARGKPPLSEAQELLKRMKEQTKLVNIDNETKKLEKDVDDVEKWAKRSTEYVDKHPIKKDISIDKLEVLVNEASKLRREAITNSFYPEGKTGDRATIFSYEFQVRTMTMLNGPKKAPLAEWEKILKNADFLQNLDALLLKLVKDETGKAYELQEEVKELQNHERNIKYWSLTQLKGKTNAKSYDDVLLLNKRMEDCRVDLPDEVIYVKGLLVRAQKVIEGIDNLMALEESGNKLPISEASSLLESSRRLPMQLAKYEAKIEGTIDRALRLAQRLQGIKTVDLATAESILKEYKTCPIILSDAERIKSAHDSSVKQFEEVEKQLKGKKVESIKADEALDLSRKLDDIQFDLGDRLYEAKLRLLRARIHHFREWIRKTEKPKKGEEVPIEKPTYTALKALLQDAYVAVRHFKQTNKDLNNEVKWLEGLARQAENRILEIYEIRDTTAIENVNPIINGYLDITQLVIEHKAGLSVDPDTYMSILASAIISDPERLELLPDFKSQFVLRTTTSTGIPPEFAFLEARPPSPPGKRTPGKRTPAAPKENRRAVPAPQAQMIPEKPILTRPSGTSTARAVAAPRVSEVVRVRETLQGPTPPPALKRPTTIASDIIERKKRTPERLPTLTETLPEEKMQTVTKDDRMFAVNELKNTIESVKAFRLNGFDAVKAARTIEEGEVFSSWKQESRRYREYLAFVTVTLRRARNYPFLARSIVAKNFNSKYLKEIAALSEESLSARNRAIATMAEQRAKEAAASGAGKKERKTATPSFEPKAKKAKDMATLIEERKRRPPDVEEEKPSRKRSTGAGEGSQRSKRSQKEERKEAATLRRQAPAGKGIRPEERRARPKRGDEMEEEEPRRRTKSREEHTGRRASLEGERPTSGRATPAGKSILKKNTVHRIFEGVFRYSHQDVLTTHLLTLADAKDISQVPKINSTGNDKLIDIVNEVALTAVGTALDQIKNGEIAGLAGWIEVPGNQESLTKLKNFGKDLFTSSQAFSFEWAKDCTLYILESESFSVNFETRHSNLLGSHQGLIDSNADANLIFIITTPTDPEVNKEEPKITPEVVAGRVRERKPAEEKRRPAISKPGQFREETEIGELGQKSRDAPKLTGKTKFSSVNFLKDYGGVQDIISKGNLLSNLLPLYQTEYDAPQPEESAYSPQYNRGGRRQQFPQQGYQPQEYWEPMAPEGYFETAPYFDEFGGFPPVEYLDPYGGVPEFYDPGAAYMPPLYAMEEELPRERPLQFSAERLSKTRSRTPGAAPKQTAPPRPRPQGVAGTPFFTQFR